MHVYLRKIDRADGISPKKAGPWRASSAICGTPRCVEEGCEKKSQGRIDSS